MGKQAERVRDGRGLRRPPAGPGNAMSAAALFDSSSCSGSEVGHPATASIEDSVDAEAEDGTDQVEGLEPFVFDLIKSLPPEILRGKYSSLPGEKPKRGLDQSLPPINNIAEIFDDVALKAGSHGFDEFLEHMGSRELRVATMCSGTESPLLALEMLSDSFKRLFGKTFRMHHLFSAEIDPFKQSYIQRNFSPDIIFRDVNELVADEATTAFGSLRKVPSNPDLLVVGFSCVDFSQLNLHRKTLEQMGESGHTFFAVLRYMDRSRPALVVLENVSGAPWKRIEEAMRQIDYHGSSVKIDTKNYYLPQTRERGYMFCVDQRKLVTTAGDESKQSPFALKMKQFQRPASSPVTEFLLTQDDPRLQGAIDDISVGSAQDRQAVDWTRYKARHLAYRMQEALGNRRPLTRWQDNGTCKMPDFYWHGWSRTQTERVWDTLDVNYLRTLVRGYDINFKSRVIDLSQGLDRELDQRASGLSGCLTPRGQHFITSRGGPLLGIEALALQGIPIGRLLLSNDGQRDLHDLAGNAMSSTVVGAAIVSALILGHKAIIPGQASQDRGDESAAARCPKPMAHVQTMASVSLDMLESDPLSTTEVIEKGKRSSRLCQCEGSTLSKQAEVLRCTKCGHTACRSCGRNPTHEYENISRQELRARISPADFERQLKTRLPMRLVLEGLSVNDLSQLRDIVLVEKGSEDNAQAWDKFTDAFAAAIGSELRFRRTTRQRYWTVTYEGSRCVLELTCWTAWLQWSLYVLPAKDEPSNSPLRKILMQPVASMVPSGDDLLEGTWYIHSPISSRFNIIVSGHGEKVESLNSRAGLQHPDFRNSTVWAHLSVSASDEVADELGSDIRGEYELLQGCGAANGSLHKKLSADGRDDVFLFLNPTEIGPPEFDSWAFALDHGRMDVGQVRDTIAEIRPNWSAFRLTDRPQTVLCWYRKRIGCSAVSLSVHSGSAHATYRIPSSDQVLESVSVDCNDSFIPLLSCSIPATEYELSWERNAWTSSNFLESPDMLHSFAWLLQRAISVNDFEEWTAADSDNQAFTSGCRLCAPEKPRLMWALDERDRVYPYEDPQDAALYERSVKNRPPVLVGYTMLDDRSVLHVQICLNLTTLLHQAIGKLNKPVKPSLQWRLCIDATGFIRPRLPRLYLQNNKADIQHAQPPGFKHFPLRPEQLRSLMWMVRQEKNDAEPFEEEEVVEALLPAINWRVEGRAAAKKSVRGGILGDDVGYGKTAISLALIDVQFQQDSVSVPDFVSGVIPVKATLVIVPHHLFDQWSREIAKFLETKYLVLELKTMSSLNGYTVEQFEKVDIVLMSASLLRGAAYYSRLEMFAGAPAVPKGDGRIFEEWLCDTMAGIRENTNLLVNEGGVPVLNRIATKREGLHNGEGFTKYRPSKRLKGLKLQEHLAKLKREETNRAADEGDDPGPATPGPPTPGLATSAPISATSKSRAKGVRSKKAKRILKKRRDTDDSSEANERQSKRVKLTAQFAEEGGENIDAIFHLRRAKHDWKRLRSPPIHMFEFNRLIIDEFTYSKDRNYASALAIPARNKWILSGTPPLNDFADVKSFAPFLGVNLGVDEDGDGKCDNERIKVMQRERTDAEQFQPFVTRRSAAWHSRRHEVAQTFLNRFMRKNEPDIDEIPWTEHICAVVLSPEERAVYLELFMQLMTQNLRIRRQGRGVYDSAEVARLDAIIGNSDGPEEALLKRCCLFAFQDATGKVSRRTRASTNDRKGNVDGGRDDQYTSESPPIPSSETNNGRHGAAVATDTHQTLLDIRRDELMNLAKDITTKLRQALYLQNKLKRLDDGADVKLQFDTLMDKIKNHEFGDWLVTLQIMRLADKAKESSDPESDEKEFYIPASEKKRDAKDTRTEAPQSRPDIISGLNYCTDSLRRLIHETVTRTRAARLFQAVRCFQLMEPGAVFGCAACRINGDNPKAFYLLGECGHSVCWACLEKCKQEEQCQYPFCSGSVQPYRVIKWSDLGHDDGMPVNDKWLTFNSSKNAELVKLLQDTNKIPQDEQAVLFVQFPELIEGASAALDLANIPHKAICSASDRTAENAITEFQTGTEEIKSRVLILALGDVTASGLNLQNANHVIFFAPLIARSQYDYESGMAQAIGRCRRYGQQKHVHIYHLLALKTIEVNIFEQRRSQLVIKRNGQYLVVPRSAVEPTDEVGWRGFSLDGTNADTYEEYYDGN